MYIICVVYIFKAVLYSLVIVLGEASCYQPLTAELTRIKESLSCKYCTYL